MPPATSASPSAQQAPRDGGGLLDLFGNGESAAPETAAPSRPTPTPPTGPPAGAGSGSGGGLLDLFGGDDPTPAPAPSGTTPATAPTTYARPGHTPSSTHAAPAAPGDLSSLLDLSPEAPAAPQSSARAESGRPDPEAPEAPRHWTDHFPKVRGTFQQDDLRQGPRVIQFDRVQSGTGHLTFSQPEGLGSPGLVQAVAQLSDGRVIGAPQGVRNRDPLVDYSTRSLKIHLRLLSQLQRFLVVFTPPQGLTAEAAAVVRMEDDFSQGSYEAHVKNLGNVRHVAAFSGFVVDGRLVIRAENRPFSCGIMEPFAAFGYALGAPQALGLMEHP